MVIAITQKDKEEFGRLYLEGYTVFEISRITHHSRELISLYLRQKGIDTKKNSRERAYKQLALKNKSENLKRWNNYFKTLYELEEYLNRVRVKPTGERFGYMVRTRVCKRCGKVFHTKAKCGRYCMKCNLSTAKKGYLTSSLD